MTNILHKYFHRISDFIWSYDLKSSPAPIVFIVKLCRTFIVTFNDLSKGQITLHATSLVYTSLLSLVPLLAVSFAILKGVGLHNYIEPFLLSLLSPLGKQSGVITTRIIETVENIQVGLLGTLGILFLIYTSVSMLGKVERIFNKTWHVKSTQSWAQRISKYTSVLVIGPMLIMLALAGVATLSSGTLIQNLLATLGLSAWVTLITKMAPYGFIILTFTFFYMFVPNTRVKFKPALIGAIVAGFLWESIGWFFTTIVMSSTNYAAIYSGLAVLILFMIWLYLSWTILLLGASIAFYTQHPEHINRGSNVTDLSNIKRERLALSAISIILQRFFKGDAAPTIADLAQSLNQEPENIEVMLAPLEEREFIKKTNQLPPTYLPGKAPETVPLSDVLSVIRASTNKAYFDENISSGVKKIMEKITAGIQNATANESLAILINKDTKD